MSIIEINCTTGVQVVRDPTPEELAVIIVENTNEVIKSQIDVLESQVTQRRIREAVLGIDNGWLQSLNEQIAVLRSQLT